MPKMKKDIPGAVYYINDDQCRIRRGLDYINFGHGKKMDFNKPANNNPGPIYDIESNFDKMEEKKNTKLKLKK